MEIRDTVIIGDEIIGEGLLLLSEMEIRATVII